MTCTKSCNFLQSSPKGAGSESHSKQRADDVQASVVDGSDTDVETLVMEVMNEEQACGTDFLAA